MLNLLPPSEKNNRRREYRQRWLLVASWLILLLLAWSLVAVFFFYWSLASDRQAMAKLLAESRSTGNAQEILELEKAWRQTEIDAKKITAYLSPQTPGLWFGRVLAAQQYGIRLTHLSFDALAKKGPSLQIAGRANDRQVFLSFIERLKSQPGLHNLDYPLSTLVRDKDLNFDLSLTLATSTASNSQPPK